VDILVLDDMVIECTNENLNITQTCDMAKFFELLLAHKWDEVWLDHDLGKDWSGRTITRMIDECARTQQDFEPDVGVFRVITMNPSTAATMVSDLSYYNCEITPISALAPSGVKRGWFLFIDPERELDDID
jgi:hypothetical protein